MIDFQNEQIVNLPVPISKYHSIEMLSKLGGFVSTMNFVSCFLFFSNTESLISTMRVEDLMRIVYDRIPITSFGQYP